jgi:hypothetical protein
MRLKSPLFYKKTLQNSVYLCVSSAHLCVEKPQKLGHQFFTIRCHCFLSKNTPLSIIALFDAKSGLFLSKKSQKIKFESLICLCHNLVKINCL